MIILIKKNKLIIILSVCIIVLISFFTVLPKVLSSHYSFQESALSVESISTSSKPNIPVFVPTYVSTPEPLKAIYMTSWVASNSKLRNSLVDIIDNTEINSVVIDIKDYSGKIVFSVGDNSTLKAFGSEEIRVSDMAQFIDSLHKKGIYVIGRVAVFQDAYFVKHRPDLAVKNSKGDQVWKDRKGISWIDVGSKEYWDYIILISKEARKIGFDEINFDYIRFPSDGNMQDISFPWSSTTPKSIALRNFFEYLHNHLKNSGLKTSADVFGMVTTAEDDMGIGQVLENTFPFFDYVMPMVYPSHYPPSFMGYNNPAKYPYEVVHSAMESAVNRAKISSTTPNKLRPWLQDFDLGSDYGPAEVRAQIKATNDLGLTSWALWSASNKYTREALKSE
ncbi:MAG: hypothetical protein AB201_03605 [Parcubacteria bacterium C7867-006]|nr:MAG: hypothetical protein AB201_03605 [Parcubacteria bacterium C7867-006]